MMRDFEPHSDEQMFLTGDSITALNLGSYNYLGFAESDLDVREKVIDTLKTLGVSLCSSRSEMGNHSVVMELERNIAQFLGKEDALVMGMGFASNSGILPALMNEGDLILSDELNHRSLVDGSRLSQARVYVFKHNSAESLEFLLRKAISHGQPGSRRPWRKIVVLSEGLFSMEGSICNLKEISLVAKKYKAYLYIDEAHSIGALGRTGRGVHEHCSISPDDIDIFMGTWTKAFGLFVFQFVPHFTPCRCQ